MIKALDDFLQRTANEGIHHYTVETELDTDHDIDAWGNEWEAGYDDDMMD